MPGGGTIRITAATGTGADAAGIVVQITDTGVGIPEHVMPSVFDPFFTTRPEGTGLGLAVAKRFIQQNGGRLRSPAPQVWALLFGCGCPPRWMTPARQVDHPAAHR